VKEILTSEEQKQALALARRTLEQFVRTGRRPALSDLDLALAPVFEREYGVFVTLHRQGQLRGCIGNIWPVLPLGEAIVERAADAASNDYRFAPVAAEELPEIDLEISVLTVPEEVSGPDDIEVGRHGVVLEKDNRRALFLPQVAPEHGWSLEQMLMRLAIKAGLPAEAWRKGARFEVFEAQVFGERKD
jgi:AmmeMemoRadiSam system protein A